MQKKQVLIVDDNRGLREALKTVFEDNYELNFASSGEDAIKAAYQRKPEVVLIDYKMPGLNGVETMEVLQKLSPKSRMVMMSAWDDRETVTNSYRGGACDFVGKPFELHEIRTVVEQAAAQSPLIQETKPQTRPVKAVVSQGEVDEMIGQTLRYACV